MKRTEHLLICLSEECSEVQKAVSKILRFGKDNHNPETMVANSAKLQNEFTDLMGTVELLIDSKILTPPSQAQVSLKKKKVLKHLEFSREAGCLDD